MLKDLLVHVPTTSRRGRSSIMRRRLRRRFGARLDAVAFGYEPISAELTFEGAAAVAAVMELQRDQALKNAETALMAFETAARQQGVTFTSRKAAAIQPKQQRPSARLRSSMTLRSSPSLMAKPRRTTILCPKRCCSIPDARCCWCPTFTNAPSRRAGS